MESNITLNLNSLYEGNIQAIIKTPSDKELSILMKDDKNGSIVGKFESSEYGKFTINANNIKKDFYIGVTNSKELDQVASSDYLIKSFFLKK